MRTLNRRFLILAIALSAVIVCSLFFYKPQKSLALSWEKTIDAGLGGGAGNQTLVSLVNFGSYLYASVGNATDGVKIFRSANGTLWTQVNTSGFGSAGCIDAVLHAFDGTLYAGTDGLGLAAGKLYKTTNGTDWTQIGTNGFGDLGNIGVVGMTDFSGHLYFGTLNSVTGTQVYRLDNTSDLTQVNLNGFDGTNTNLETWSMKVFNDELYAGTGTGAAGGQIWKTANGTTWTKLMDGGFGDATNLRISSLFSFGSKLYAGTLNAATGTEVWRVITSAATEWEQINSDGFGDANNTWTGDTVAVVNGTIYLGTRNDATGAELYTSTNGSSWTKEGLSGFGDAGSFAIYAITFNGQIYIGFSNVTTGAEIWRTGAMGTLSISTTSLSDGTVDSTYSETIELENGTSPFTYSLSGSLPDGLSLDYSTGEISGTPTRDGTSTFTIAVLDAGSPQQMASRELSIKVNALATPTPTPTPSPSVLPETGADR